MNLCKAVADSVAPKWIAQLGRTPDYLDPQSQEALHEVDVSGMTLPFSSDQHQGGTFPGASEKGAGSNQWVTEPDACHDTD